MTTVSWGRRDRYRFVSSGALKSWVPPALPAVYAITYKKEPEDRPKEHTVFYFGDAADLAQEASGLNQKVLESWSSTGGSIDDLYVFVHTTANISDAERLRICKQLILDYRPHANDN